jgi:hypothetical protein
MLEVSYKAALARYGMKSKPIRLKVKTIKFVDLDLMAKQTTESKI